MNITEEDFTKIIQDNEDRLRHLCRVYADCEEDAKDLYQEIVIQIWRSLSSFKEDAKIGTWIYRLAVNTAISFVRKKKTRANYYSKYRKEKKPKKKYSIPPRQADKDGQVKKLYEAISVLNASEKAIITMYLEDFSYTEIAFVTDISENYVGVKLHRIKNKLSKVIGDDHGTE